MVLEATQEGFLCRTIYGCQLWKHASALPPAGGGEGRARHGAAIHAPQWGGRHLPRNVGVQAVSQPDCMAHGGRRAQE